MGLVNTMGKSQYGFPVLINHGIPCGQSPWIFMGKWSLIIHPMELRPHWNPWLDTQISMGMKTNGRQTLLKTISQKSTSEPFSPDMMSSSQPSEPSCSNPEISKMKFREPINRATLCYMNRKEITNIIMIYIYTTAYLITSLNRLLNHEQIQYKTYSFRLSASFLIT